MNIDFNTGLRLTGYHWNQEQEGVPLIILHGFLEQSLAWETVASKLARPVFAYDHRGHGCSDHIGRGSHYEFWDYVSDLDSVLETIRPDQPVDLLGHSMGGSIAAMYAGTRPERIRRLVLVEGLGPPDASHKLVERAKLALLHRKNGLSHGVPLESVAAAAKRMRLYNPGIDPAFALRLADRHTIPVDGGVQWRWDARHRQRAPRAFVAEHFVQWLARIRSQTLVVEGADSTFNAEHRFEHLQDAMRVELPGCGHLVHHDDPKGLASCIETFLSALPTTSPAEAPAG